MRRCTQDHGGEFPNSLVKRLHQGTLGKDGGTDWIPKGRSSDDT